MVAELTCSTFGCAGIPSSYLFILYTHKDQMESRDVQTEIVHMLWEDYTAQYWFVADPCSLSPVRSVRSVQCSVVPHVKLFALQVLGGGGHDVSRVCDGKKDFM